MGDGTAIEWTDATWNPIRGCSMVSAGCTNCYAQTVARRFSGPGQPYEGLTTNGKWNGTVKLVESALAQPLRWRRPRKIFVNSMSDLFHESLSNETIAAIFGVMAAAPQHTFQVLTKRPKRMAEWFRRIGRLPEPPVRAMNAALDILRDGTRFTVCSPAGGADRGWPLRNVWLGVSVEHQAAADERIPLLLETPAAVRFLSCGPLLGAVDLERVQWPGKHKVDVLRGGAWDAPGCGGGFTQHSDMKTIDWVIAGGESGHGARPMHAAWARSLRDQCAAAGVPYFFKQWGEWAPLVRGLDDDGVPHVFHPSVPNVTSARQCDTGVTRVGKKAAGSLLDGVEHKAFPGVKP